MHIIVSFREGEIPSKDTLKDIEYELLKSICRESRHRLSVTHNDTANFHIHIAINKIHLETKKLIDSWQSKKKLDRKAIELEEKHGKKSMHSVRQNWQHLH